MLANIGSEAVSIHKYNKKEKNIGKCLLLMIRLNSIMKLISPMKFIRSLLGVNIKMTLMIKNSLLNKCFFSVRR